jgi:thiol-disulfide isomerase/thioredoxin
MQHLTAIAFGVAAVCQGATAVPSSTCPLQNCALKSSLAKAGPGFQDGLRFFSIKKGGVDSREACPFSDDDDPEPSKKEYMKYMKAMGKVADMPLEERRKYALKRQKEWLNKPEEEVNKEPSIDISKPGVEAVNSTTWSELRRANSYDMLVAFYAPWCPHCKTFVTAEHAPINALSESLAKVDGPKVVKFDITDTSPPAQLGVTAVPTIYLFKKTGEAILFEGNPHNAEEIMSFSLDKPVPAPKAQALVEKQVVQHQHQSAVPSWQCALKNCMLKSPLALAGPAHQDGVHFFAAGSGGKDTRQACPFSDADTKEPTTKEYMKYMKAMDEIGDMSTAERRAWALAHANDPVVVKKKEIKPPSIDLSKAGVPAVNSTTWSELRKDNKYDILIAFYAPWCPHCKAFVTSENAPIKALSESLQKAGGPKVVSFDVIADDPPLTIDAVPTIYLFQTNGYAILFEGDAFNSEELMAFALQDKTPKPVTLVAKEVTKHLRSPSA